MPLDTLDRNKIIEQPNKCKEEIEVSANDKENSVGLKKYVDKDLHFRKFELKKNAEESPRKKLGKDFLSKLEKN